MVVRTGIVGAGEAGRAVIALLAEAPGFEVTVVADRDATAPGIGLARARGIPVATSATEAFAYRVDLVVETTGDPEVLAALRAAAPAGVEVMGARGAGLVRALAERGAAGGETARAFRTLAALARTIVGSLENAEVFRAIAEAAARLVGADAATLSVFDEQTQQLSVRADYGFRDPEGRRTRSWRPGEGLVGWVAERLQPVFLPDFAGDPRVTNRAWARAEGLLACGAVPLRLGEGRLVGVLTVFYRRPHAFGAEEVRLLTALGDLAAVAIVNARLYADLQHALESLRASQERRMEAERLRALGEMAAGIAHHFNNMLAGILGRAQLLLLLEPAEARVRQGLQTIEQLVLEGAQMVRRFQVFTRVRDAPGRAATDLGRVVADAVEFTRVRWETEARAAGRTYRIDTTAEPVPPVLGDEAELREAVVNLLLNALDAMPAGGAIGIGVRAVGPEVEMRLSDTGTGMTEEVRRRALEPFFTTKGPRASGLGLPVAYGIVRRHGGRLEIETVPGRGTTVVVRLPAAPRPEAAAPGTAPAPPGWVLVVEEEEAVRAVLVDALTSFGYRVVAVADGSEGARLARDGGFDLVLADVSLPGESGWAVAAAARAARPRVPVAFVTGWGAELDPDRVRSLEPIAVLSKPFRVTDLADLVARLTGRPIGPPGLPPPAPPGAGS